MRSFASDNNASVHPVIMQAIREANQDHAVGYGDDPWTEHALASMRRIFGEDCEPFIVLTGTGANVLSLQAVLRCYESVLCADCAHLNVDECGAPERITGAKLVTVPSDNGLIKLDTLRPLLHAFGNQHVNQPRMVSITQCTEYGTLYQPEEVRAIADFAHKNNMLLHMDGARIANAAAALGLGLRECTRELGVDVLSFGGTKNGMMCGEAVVFFTSGLSRGVKNMRKQAMQLVSKMRYVSAQFTALLQNDLWQRNAVHANRMAGLLAHGMEKILGVSPTRPVQTNHVFVELPPKSITRLQQEYFFYVWNQERNECRFVTSWDTCEEDIRNFLDTLKKSLD